MKSLIVLGLLFALANADDVLEFGDSDFDSNLAKYDTALVMFYAPWCGHCKRLKPEFEKAASILKNNDPPVHLIKVDCTEAGKESCSRFGVSGYPTLKIFRSGELSSDYNGPREQAGIVKYMRAQVGPASKELKSLKEAKDYLSKDEVTVVYFGGASSLKDTFMKTANKLRETVRFANSESEEVLKQYEYKDQVVLFRPPNMQNKFEPSAVLYKDDDLDAFIKSNYHGLVGLRTQDSAKDFKPPLVIGFYNVDYVKNPKGTNYWRNRIMKVAQDFKADFSFAISSKDDFQHELNEFGVDYSAGDKPIVCAHYNGEKYVMKDEFSMDSFREFLKNLKDGKLEAYIKSEAVPSSQGDVKVAVRKNFDELVTNSGRDALVEFYAPWCGHCKKLAPIYDELGEKMKGESVDIVKMDATANDVPAGYDVRGFPTIFWKPKSGPPVPYNSGRELDDFIKFIAKEASSELNGYDRSGNEKKSEL